MDNMEFTHWGIKDMKWGVRRYQNKDGTLTEAGKKRYARDQRENAGKKKGDRVATADPNRWFREDLERSKKFTDAGQDLSRNLSNLNRSTSKVSSKTRLNLDSMSDQQMREKINRELLERQYNDIFNPKKVSRGRETVDRTLEVAGAVLGVASSSLAIALSIKTLTGK